ncbi:hypothetical protein PCC7424_2534 [Gloeothece citriformis PCC 7424]|uniref:Uncharacterized protein n=1 Tax=Gloeothece citriformis (strain PCC 7424) TaxID=65393 RepID=B7KK66_GLOC7|nr:hypothetical protein PCC7424_2534 [Gloeothece citriformis PCC 7424]
MTIEIFNKQIIRNYLLVLATVMTTSIGIAELFHSPNRLAKENKLKSYAPYLNAGFVNYGIDFLHSDSAVISP